MDRELLQFLLDREYAVMIGTTPALTKKFNILFPQAMPSREAIRYIFPKDNAKELWNKFIEDADVPHRVKAPDGMTYTVRQYSVGAAAKLLQIVSTNDFDYEKFVESTKHYYKTVSYKALLSNYLFKDIWKGEYDNYEVSKQSIIGGGASKWED